MCPSQPPTGDSKLWLRCHNILNRDGFLPLRTAVSPSHSPPKWIFWVAAQTCCQDGLEWEFHPVRTTSLSSALLLWEYPGSFLTKAADLNARIVNGAGGGWRGGGSESLLGVWGGQSPSLCDCAVISNEDVLRKHDKWRRVLSSWFVVVFGTRDRPTMAMQYV